MSAGCEALEDDLVFPPRIADVTDTVFFFVFCFGARDGFLA